MKQMTTTVAALIHAGHSPSGNLRWEFTTEDGLYLTADDLAQSYELTGNESGPVQLWLDDRDTIHRWVWQDRTPTKN